MILRLQHAHLLALKEAARKAYPIEACALLFGEIFEKESIIKKVVVASNTLQSTVRFEIDPEVVVKAYLEADKEGLDLLGVFHSHPALATPSSIDIKYMKLWGAAFWLILSLITGNLAAYQIINDSIQEVMIKVE